MNKIDPYIKRPVKFLKQVSAGDWKIKVYGISAKTEPLPTSLIDVGIAKILPQLPGPAVTEDRYGVGFLIIHQGILRNWFLLDWWGYEDLLHHRLFSSLLDRPDTITTEEGSSVLACVHELRVIHFESEAWIKTTLNKNDSPDFDRYMKLRLNEDN